MPYKSRLQLLLTSCSIFGSVFVPLASVQAEWRHWNGMEHLHTIGLHNNIFRDVFCDEFQPKGFIQVTYGDAGGVIHHGNLVTPEQAASAPKVQLPLKLRRREREGGYASLLLTNPDGHLRDNTLEVLHWMV